MISAIIHVGLTVSDLERAVGFYRDVLGLSYVGELLMEGPETEALFRKKGCRARVAYLNGGKNLHCPPVELIQFESDIEHREMDLFRSGISELCFETDDIWADYRRLKGLGVEFLSEPQEFDFAGFGKSRAVYLRDPDGIILELLEHIQ